MTTAASREQPSAKPTLAAVLVDAMWQLGMRQAYGVCGREIAPLWAALLRSSGKRRIACMHTRHENGAGYAAYGSWAVTGRPVGVFVTTGPGLTNVITSLEMARAAGAKLVLLSPLTPSHERGRLGIQDTSSRGFRSPELYEEGRLFDLVATVEAAADLETVIGQLAMGLAGVHGFMAHIAVPTNLLLARMDFVPTVPAHRRAPLGAAPGVVDEVVGMLAAGPFAVCVGWGARHHAAGIRRLLERTGAPAISTPRGLGIVDRDRHYLGVIGNGGQEGVLEALSCRAPERMLVLGSGLGEATSGWLAQLAPPLGFVHVDLDAKTFARAYPQTPTLAIQADIGEFVGAVLARGERLVRRQPVDWRLPQPRRFALVRHNEARGIHPSALMAALQRVIVDGSDMPVLADAASAMFWGTRHLVFDEPGRWLVENRFGAMGGAAAAVLGAAAGRSGPALAIVGDGAMHMQDEINSAVRYGVRAIWVILNDGGLGIVRHGMKANGWGDHDADYPATDFAAVARAKGAAGLRVTCERDLERALSLAAGTAGPFVLDVPLDPDAAPPIGARARRSQSA